MNDNFNFKHKAEAIEWRRGIVLSRLAMGHNQESIAKELQLHPSTISLDVQYLKEQARQEVKSFIDKLPLMILKSTTALSLISAETWKLVNSPDANIRDKISALALLKDVERQKVELFNNANIVDALVGAAEQQTQKNTSDMDTLDSEDIIAAELDANSEEESKANEKAEEEELADTNEE